MNQDFKININTSHISLSQVSYGVTIVRIWDKIDHVMLASHSTWVAKSWRLVTSNSTCSHVSLFPIDISSYQQSALGGGLCNFPWNSPTWSGHVPIIDIYDLIANYSNCLYLWDIWLHTINELHGPGNAEDLVWPLIPTYSRVTISPR